MATAYAGEAAEPEHGSGPPSLASYRVSLPEQVTPPVQAQNADRSVDDALDGAPLDRCPRKLGWFMVNRELQLVRPARCKANSCAYCCPLNAILVGGAIALARPQRAIRFSLVGDEWQLVRQRMFRLRNEIKAAGFGCHWAWHCEPNPKGTGHHVHAWQRGDFIPQARLQELCERRGMGFPYIERLKASIEDGDSVKYGMKMATGLGYGMKLSEARETAATYLRANGGRLVHASRGFWQVEGEQVGQREAMSAWARLHGQNLGGSWEMVREEHVELAMGPAC